MGRLLISNAKIVNEGQITEGDVLIEQGRIAAIGVTPTRPEDQVLDAAGRYLLPGMIDSQSNYREPGLPLLADMASESQAAVAGGVTSFLDLPDSVNGTTTLEQLQEKQQLAQGVLMPISAFIWGASRDNIELIAALEPDQACAINVYMGGDVHDVRLLDDPDVLEQLFNRSPLMVAVHCEDMPTILENEESYRGIYGDSIPVEFHPVIRSEEACQMSSRFALELAGRCGTRLHVMQVSTAQEVEMLSDAGLDNKNISADVCAHFLHFADEDYAAKGALLKTNPAIKTAEDRAGLIQGLMDGRLDLVSSGHAPQDWEQKQEHSYFSIPSGMPMVQHALLAVLENYHSGIFSLEFIAEKTSHAVAELFDIQERGYIREGYWADLVLVDVESGGMATHSNSLSRCGWTPFDGYKFRSSIAATLVNGQLVWREGRLQDKGAVGQALLYRRS
ncbi:MAG: dihydroorotase [Thiolinea sp.]